MSHLVGRVLYHLLGKRLSHQHSARFYAGWQAVGILAAALLTISVVWHLAVWLLH